MTSNSLYPWIRQCPWYMAVILESITAIHHDHSVVELGQTVVFLVRTAGGTFDLRACHSENLILYLI